MNLTHNMKSASTFESHWLKQVHDQAHKIDPSLHDWHQDALYTH